MSLINQVLRDLDRQARPAAALPAALPAALSAALPAALPATLRAAVAAVAIAPGRRRAAAATALLGLLALGSVVRLGAGPGVHFGLADAAGAPAGAAVSAALPVSAFGSASASVTAPAMPLETATASTAAPPSAAELAAASVSAPWSLTTGTLLAAAGAVAPESAGAAGRAVGDDSPSADTQAGAWPHAPGWLRPTRLRLDLDATGGDAPSATRGAFATTASTSPASPTASNAFSAFGGFGWFGGFAVPGGLAAAAVTPVAAAAAAASGAAAGPETASSAAAVNLASAAVVAPAAATSPPPPAPNTSPVRIEKRATAVGPADRADAAYRLGAAAQQRGDYAEAAGHYAAALHDDAALAAARVGWAGVLTAQGRAAEAEVLLQAGLATNPRQAALAMPLARLLAARGDLTTAIGVLQAGLPGALASQAGQGAQADYRACLGAVLQRAGQHRDAAEQFNAALRLAPGNGVWWMGLAISLAADGRADAARTAYQQALAAGGLSPELAQFVEQRLRQLL